MIALLLALLAQAASPDPEVKLPAREKFKVFLLIGQSNMAGRGAVEEQDRKPHPRVLTLTKDDAWAPAVDPIHFDKPKIAGVGLGTTFGRTVAESFPDATIGLIPCAVGGSSIAQWAKDQPFRREAVRRAKLAIKVGTLGGILWHQGEADVSRGATYAADATKLFIELRVELEAPDVPIVVGTLGDFAKGADAFNPVLSGLAKATPRCGLAEANGLVHKGDGVHFDSASLRELGKRYAAEWLKLEKTR